MRATKLESSWGLRGLTSSGLTSIEGGEPGSNPSKLACSKHTDSRTVCLRFLQHILELDLSTPVTFLFCRFVMPFLGGKSQFGILAHFSAP